MHLPWVPRPPPRRRTAGPRAARPVRDAGLPGAIGRPTPRVSLADWDFTIVGEVDELVRWSWDELQALPSEMVTVDIHCVTKWSKLDTAWEGVSVDTLLEGVETSAEYALAFCDGGYTTNVPLEDLTGGKAWVAYEYDGEPLDPEHGGPARLLVPHRTSGRARRGPRPAADVERRARLLGVERLPPVRRPVAGAAVLGRLTWQVATVAEVRPETPRTKTLARSARVGRAPRGSARGHPAHGRGRLPGTAELLDRVRVGARIARADGRADRRRRGLAVPDGRSTARRRARSARPDRSYLSGTRSRR